MERHDDRVCLFTNDMVRATHVPVGEDQKQHLEFARECATNFNATYGSTTLVPPAVLLCT